MEHLCTTIPLVKIAVNPHFTVVYMVNIVTQKTNIMQKRFLTKRILLKLANYILNGFCCDENNAPI